MIQRIQTLYLLIVLVLSMFTLLSPVIELASADACYTLSIRGLELSGTSAAVGQPSAGGEAVPVHTETIGHAWMLSVISAIIPLITLITIWLYKFRQAQIRLTVFNSLLMVGYYGLFFLYLFLYKGKYEADSVSILLPAIFPVICIILNILAIRGIAKDDALVKSYERLR